MRHSTFAAAAVLAMVASAAPVTAQDQGEIQLVKSVLSQLNTLSFKNNREYCGYIGFDAAGKLVATPAKKGRPDSCLANDPPEDMVLVASYHTHGAFTPDAFSEFPSSTDIEGDEEEGIDGYVATPGGRLWYIDGQDMEASQICGLGCLPQDPAFEAGLDGEIYQSYTYEEILQQENDS